MLRTLLTQTVRQPATARSLSQSRVASALPEKKSEKLWGGRFTKDTDQSVQRWTESVTIDSHMVREDIWGSIAHVSMLGRQGIVKPEKASAIVQELGRIYEEYENGTYSLGYQQEDVHMNNEAELIRRLGMDIGGRMHTCRSRNDQVCLDSKLYVRKRILELRGRVLEAADAFITRATPHTEDVMPSYTHFQHAQPVSIAFWLSHYAAILYRDAGRLKDAFDTIDMNPLGAGAISGTSFPIDRMLTTKIMGFQKVHEHAMDATSSRDYMWDSLNSAAMVSNTLSRLAEEFILFSSYEYRTLSMDDGFAMGSSMMPQKKNPGCLELIRGRCGRMTGYATAGFVMTKGLPSAYNRDFHEDKEILVRSMDLINMMVEVIPPLVQSTNIHKERMAELCDLNFATATELANYLVLKHDVPFREAHHVVGSLVGELYRAGDNFTNFPFCYEHLKKCGITAPENEVRDVLDSKTVMMSYNCIGGTGKQAVETSLHNMRQQSQQLRDQLAQDNDRVNSALANALSLTKEIGTAKTQEELGQKVAKFFPGV